MVVDLPPSKIWDLSSDLRVQTAQLLPTYFLYHSKEGGNVGPG